MIRLRLCKLPIHYTLAHSCPKLGIIIIEGNNYFTDHNVDSLSMLQFRAITIIIVRNF